MSSSVEIDFDVECTMRDGTILRADVYRSSATEGDRPVLLSRLPYGKANVSQLGILNPIYFARAGYLVVLQDTRGRGTSDGEWHPLAAEPDDGFDTVRWAASLPGSDGRVCMYGASYFGNTQWTAAGQAPPELIALAPLVTWFDVDQGVFSRGGARELGLSVDWSLRNGFEQLARRYASDSARRRSAFVDLAREIDQQVEVAAREVPTSALPAFQRHSIAELGFEADLLDPRLGDAVSPARFAHLPEIPAFHIAGWFDVFGQGSLDAFIAQRAAGVDAQLLVGPWRHESALGSRVGDIEFGVGADSGFVDLDDGLWVLEREWFDRQTTGAPATGAPVRIFVMGANIWRDEQEWPLARAVDTPLFLAPGGVLTTSAPTQGSDEFVSDLRNPVPSRGGAMLIASAFPAGPLDQSPVEQRDDVLVYTGDELDHDLEVTGRVRATLHGSADSAPHDWVVRVCDVGPDGVSYNVVDGIVRVEDAVEGVHEIDLWSTSWVFKRGHRIRVQVTGSCFPRWDRAGSREARTESELPVIRQRVHLGGDSPTAITLPVIPAD